MDEFKPCVNDCATKDGELGTMSSKAWCSMISSLVSSNGLFVPSFISYGPNDDEGCGDG